MEREGEELELVDTVTMSNGKIISFYVDKCGQSKEEVLTDVYTFIAESYMRRQNGHPL